MKGVKKLLGVFVFALLFFVTNVSAVEIDSVESLKEAFDGKNATVKGTTVTLTGDVEFKNPNWTEGSDEAKYDAVNIAGDDYILNLNGYSIRMEEFYVEDGSITINDSTKEGSFETVYALIQEGAKAVIDVENFVFGDSLIDNSGELTIKNGKFHSIWNFGTLVIDNGSFANLLQEGKATINGGTFTAYKRVVDFGDGETGEVEYYSQFNLDAKTVIAGGEFKKTNTDYAFNIQSGNPIDSSSINDIVKDGYLPVYDKYTHISSDSWVDNETGETMYSYVGAYDSLKITKDNSKEIFEKIAPNGVWTINGSKPTNMEDAEFLLTAMAGDIEVPKGYEIYAFVEPADKFNPEDVSLYLYYKNSLLKNITIKAVYNEPSKEVKTEVNHVLDKISDKIGENLDEETGFLLEDLYLINYLNVSEGGRDDSKALNFSKDLIALTNGSNISYKFDSRLGSFTPTGLWGFSGGKVIVYHDGVAVGTTNIGLTTSHVIYVSSDTKDTDEARIEAALKRIKEYLGTNVDVKIEVGGTLDSLNEDEFTWKDHGFIDEKTSGANYYNITIRGEVYKFAICKKDDKKLETPEFLASDVTSNITIKSTSTEVPLDTAITVKEVESDEIKEALGTNKYTAYDISLYSNAKDAKITKLENDKFIVSVPVPKNLKGKDLVVYYVNDNGKKEEHVSTIKDNIVSFETNHFSTYVLTEKVIENPNTLDNVGMNAFIGFISLIGIVGSILYIKRKEN